MMACQIDDDMMAVLVLLAAGKSQVLNNAQSPHRSVYQSRDF
jgi:hypothetical protein